jgi:hypothetical protein
MIVKLKEPQSFQSASGKRAKNSKVKISFKGNRILEGVVGTVVKALQSTTSGTGGIFGSSVGILSLSSLFSNALAFLSKLIQIIEFSGLMEYFNVDFDENLGIFLRELNKATSFDLMNLPLKKYSKSFRNTIAGPYRGKLTRVEIPPYFIQEVGYPGIVMIVSFFLIASAST